MVTAVLMYKFLTLFSVNSVVTGLTAWASLQYSCFSLLYISTGG